MLKAIKSILPYWGIGLLGFYALPLIGRSAVWVSALLLLAVLPLLCLVCGIVHGLRNGFQLLLGLGLAALFVPTVWIYYNETALVYAVGYLAVALAGNALGGLMKGKR